LYIFVFLYLYISPGAFFQLDAGKQHGLPAMALLHQGYQNVIYDQALQKLPLRRILDQLGVFHPVKNNCLNKMIQH
jgi:hypothetical protein